MKKNCVYKKLASFGYYLKFNENDFYTWSFRNNTLLIKRIIFSEQKIRFIPVNNNNNMNINILYIIII